MIFWLNGEFSQKTNTIDIADRGFLLGDGVFETILVVDGVPAFWDAHLSRLRNAINALGIDVQVGASILGAVLELVARNKLSQGLASVRLTVSRGPGGRGLPIPTNLPAGPTLLATISKFYGSSDPAPMQLNVSSFVRSEASLTSRHKTLNYLDNVMARNEAAETGCDEAVMLNSAGRVACVSAGNIFLLTSDGAVVTPAADEGALNGIVRGILLGADAQTGLAIKETTITQASLMSAGLIVTNSLLGVRPAFIKGARAAPDAATDNSLQRLQSWYERALANDLEQRAGVI